MTATASRKAARRLPLWPKFRQVERQAQLLSEMMEKFGVDPGAAAREDRGRAFATARRRCLWCNRFDECREWLELGGSGVAPQFCPNAAYLNRVRSAKDGL